MSYVQVEDYPPSLPWWNAATAGVTVFVPDCGAEDQQSVMPLEQETVPASAVASGLAAAALNPTAAALNLESEQGQQVPLSCLHNARQTRLHLTNREWIC